MLRPGAAWPRSARMPGHWRTVRPSPRRRPTGRLLRGRRRPRQTRGRRQPRQSTGLGESTERL
eukprot:5414050-Alexandrium_andersonii.AAC.1